MLENGKYTISFQLSDPYRWYYLQPKIIKHKKRNELIVTEDEPSPFIIEVAGQKVTSLVECQSGAVNSSYADIKADIESEKCYLGVRDSSLTLRGKGGKISILLEEVDITKG